MISDAFESVRKGMYGADGSQPDDVDLRQANGSKQTLLHVAIASRQVDIARALLARGIDANAPDDQGQTALHYCGVYRLPEIAEGVLEHGGQLSIADRHGNTPVWTAVFGARGDYRLVEILLNHGGGSLADSKNRHGRSPLDFAKQIGDASLIAMLSRS